MNYLLKRKVGNEECDLPEAKRGKCFRKGGKGSVMSYTIERQHEVEIEEWLLDLAMEAPLAIVSQQSRETRSLFGASGGMTGKSGRRADSSLLKF